MFEPSAVEKFDENNVIHFPNVSTLPEKRIITAWAESASGPGWSNSFINVLVENVTDSSLHIETIKSPEFSKEMHLLFGMSALASSQMLAAVKKREEN
jgi:hypothetical protein